MLVKELFEEQRNLDIYIMGKLKEKNINIENENELLAYRLLALITELGEISGALQEEKLEEYADLMHFVLSVGNLSNIRMPYKFIDFREMYELLRCKTKANYLDALQSFIVSFSNFSNSTRAFKYWSNKPKMAERLQENYIDMFFNFIHLGHSLGYTGREVEETYIIKNKVNYQRQDEGY